MSIREDNPNRERISNVLIHPTDGHSKPYQLLQQAAISEICKKVSIICDGGPNASYITIDQRIELQPRGWNNSLLKLQQWEIWRKHMTLRNTSLQ